MANYDFIIAGAGLAGCSAAYVAAKGGLKTLVVERGKRPGAKNVTGGRIYAHSLEKLIPGFAQEAPVERCITTEKLSFLTEKDATTLEYSFPENPDFAKRSYSVLRAKFDEWLWSKAEAVGAELKSSSRIDSLLYENGKYIGVKVGKEEIYAPLILISDGVNSTIAQRAGLAPKPTPNQLAIGVKEVIKFDERTMRDRFGCIGNRGLAWIFAGDPTYGHMGGGFLYTNKTSVSVGLVFGMSGLAKDRPGVPAMLERFKRHPAIAPLLDGGKLIQYPAHMVPEGGYDMIPPLVGNGVMIAGDAAGMCINLGYTVRGMDFAIASGQYAGETAIQAHKDNNYGFEELSLYRDKLAQSFVLKEMEFYSQLPQALDNKRIFTTYPQLVSGLMGDIFTVDGIPKSLTSKFWNRARETGAINLIKDGINLLGAL